MDVNRILDQSLSSARRALRNLSLILLLYSYYHFYFY